MSLWLASTITRLEEHSNRITVAVRRARRREKAAAAQTKHPKQGRHLASRRRRRWAKARRP